MENNLQRHVTRPTILRINKNYRTSLCPAQSSAYAKVSLENQTLVTFTRNIWIGSENINRTWRLLPSTWSTWGKTTKCNVDSVGQHAPSENFGKLCRICTLECWRLAFGTVKVETVAPRNVKDTLSNALPFFFAVLHNLDFTCKCGNKKRIINTQPFDNLV